MKEIHRSSVISIQETRLKTLTASTEHGVCSFCTDTTEYHETEL